MVGTELHEAAELGDVPVIRRILAESPGDATAADSHGRLPLHQAAIEGLTAVVKLLLAAAPQAALVADGIGWLPLHWAVRDGHTAVVELLLEAAPQTERARTAEGETALLLAASHGHLPAARVVLQRSAAAPTELITELLAAICSPAIWLVTQQKKQHVAHALLADLAALRALSPADWALLPTPCPALARALPAVIERSPAEAAQLVAHLPFAARGRLRTLALSLAHLQRRLRLELPESIMRRILAAAPLEEQREEAEEGPSDEEEEWHRHWRDRGYSKAPWDTSDEDEDF
eukprot:scaffold8.g1737.t1